MVNANKVAVVYQRPEIGRVVAMQMRSDLGCDAIVVQPQYLTRSRSHEVALAVLCWPALEQDVSAMQRDGYRVLVISNSPNEVEGAEQQLSERSELHHIIDAARTLLCSLEGQVPPEKPTRLRAAFIDWARPLYLVSATLQ